MSTKCKVLRRVLNTEVIEVVERLYPEFSASVGGSVQ
jgi:hypothetical protein